jgi:hypothetical protein
MSNTIEILARLAVRQEHAADIHEALFALRRIMWEPRPLFVAYPRRAHHWHRVPRRAAA